MALLKIIMYAERNRHCWLGRRPVAAALACLLWWGLAVSASAQPAREYQLKAVFLFNFAQFVEWPTTAFPDDESPLIVGVLGEDPFGATLDETVQGELVGHRNLIVRRYRRVEEITDCHILFIGKSESPRLESIVSALRGRDILTVSDADQAAQRGVMIRFVTENKKIRLRINLEVAKLAGLTISSKLLRPAEIVTTGKN